MSLRKRFVPEHADNEVIAFWSQLVKRDATSPVFQLPSQAWRARLCSVMPLLHRELGSRFSQLSSLPLSPQTRLLTQKISANSGVDQGCPLSACGFSAVVDPVLRSVMAQLCTHYDTGAKLFAYLDDWYLWIKPKCLLQTIAVITAATRSVNLALQSTKTQVWKGSCQDPIPPEFQDKVTLTLSCLGGHLQIHGDTEPSPVVLGEQATMEKTMQRFQKIATTLADLIAEGLNVQTVNDLLTMYVGAASQHVLRMSFVPEQEAQNFDRQVITFWSRLMHRDIASPLFFLPLKLGGLGVGSAVQRHAAAHGARGSRSFLHVDGNNPISGHRLTFQFNTTTACPTLSTPIHPLPTNE